MRTDTYDETKWRLAPVEPTENQLFRGCHSTLPNTNLPELRAIYSMMLRAAPCRTGGEMSGPSGEQWINDMIKRDSMTSSDLLRYSWDLLSEHECELGSFYGDFEDLTPSQLALFQLIMANIVTQACTVPD